MGGIKSVLLDRLPDHLDLVREKAEIVNGGKAQTQNFASTEQVMDVGCAEPGTRVAVALRIEGPMDVGEPALLDADSSLSSE